MKTKKDPLYRKVNTKASGCRHNKGEKYAYRRNKKNVDESMKRGVKRGLDYTPLFKFLLSSVGKNWDEIYSKVVSRVESKDPIFWMVLEGGKPLDIENLTILKNTNQSFVRVSENTYFSSLYVDENNLLQKINPKLTIQELHPQCACCTHTLNGIAITNRPTFLTE